MKNFLYLSMFILILITTSCGKNWTKTVKGKVLNPVTGEEIANARVILQKEGSGVPSGLKTVEAVYTDAKCKERFKKMKTFFFKCCFFQKRNHLSLNL